MSLRIVHYLNQFFGQIGGEDKADLAPQIKDGPVGPGNGINGALGDKAEIVKTIICGDDYFNENTEAAEAEIRKVLAEIEPDLVIAGPAFNAGRYGMACGNVAEVAKEEFDLAVISAMYPENPGYDMYKNYAYIIETGDSAAGMREAIPNIAELVTSYIEKDGQLGRPDEEGYMPRGLRKNQFVKKRGSKRAVEMLVNKIKGEEFETEYPMPDFDRVEPVDPIDDLAEAKVALVTSGGIVPKGNPDRIESSSASKYGEYDISDYETITSESHETAHGGYDPVYANEDPNRVLPVDVARELEAEGAIGELHDRFYSTVGNGTAVANAKAYAQEIADKLVNEGVQAVVLTSTWGTCTRCGATMVKEIERAGLPVVHLATVVPISKTVGANRIVPAVAIPHPLGDPDKTPEQEKAIRKDLVQQGLTALETEIEGQTVFGVEEE